MSETHPIVSGFRFAGVSCGIKDSGKPDLGLILADDAFPTAAMFTRNRIQAAPVVLAAERMERGRAQAILVNSGNANSCTGKAGLDAARDTTIALADALDMNEDLVLPASTGIIGQQLPSERIEAAVPQLIEDLSPDGVNRFAEAIRTTDRWPKVASIQFGIGYKETATLVGVAKGAGMIHPDMATTLGFVLTDAPMSSSFLKTSLRRAVEQTFNAMTVDGETSTNDSMFAMASGRVDTPALRGSDRDAKRFQDAMIDVLGELAKSIVRDGEGAQRVVRLEVAGGPSESASRQVAERVATSLLVKAAIHGCDPNWGRILSAAGMAPVAIDLNKVEIRIGKVVVFKKGAGLGPSAEADAREQMRQAEYTIRIKLGSGTGNAHYLLCDIGPEYIRVNSAYST
ncbi:MAG: bifunctional glutamate N-acetyltransferase/amino-acid acetyltransferase ArgJ [Myxococcota bacterium]